MTPVLISVSLLAVGIIAFVAVSLSRQLRLRRHLKRLRNMPLDSALER